MIKFLHSSCISFLKEAGSNATWKSPVSLSSRCHVVANSSKWWRYFSCALGNEQFKRWPRGQIIVKWGSPMVTNKLISMTIAKWSPRLLATVQYRDWAIMTLGVAHAPSIGHLPYLEPCWKVAGAGMSGLQERISLCRLHLLMNSINCGLQMS